MKTKILRIGALVVACCVSLTSCYTTYDANGRPVQSVDPGTAAAGVVAAGVLGYALADGHGYGGYYGGPYYYGRPGYYGRPYYRNVYYRDGGGRYGYYRGGYARQRPPSGYVRGSHPVKAQGGQSSGGSGGRVQGSRPAPQKAKAR